MFKKPVKMGSRVIFLVLFVAAIASQLGYAKDQNVMGPRQDVLMHSLNNENHQGTKDNHVIKVNEVPVTRTITTTVNDIDDLTYPVVDTNQNLAFDVKGQSVDPLPFQSSYGQDANYLGHQPDYTDNGDGTVTDNVTGLMWSNSPGEKVSYQEAIKIADSLNLGGYSDWRLATIKELYSLIDFSGIDPEASSTNETSLRPFIDTDYFDFSYGDIGTGERIIDSQFISRTKYTSTTMFGNETVFGVNFADGRIKGYPVYDMKKGEDKKFYALYVRGNTSYGQNDYFDNGDGTITDRASGLMWMKTDSGEGMDWEAALAYANSSNYAGYDDWRLPNAKELQSIVDYSNSPHATNSAAIAPVFNISKIEDESGGVNYPFYWSSTTHISSTRGGLSAVYVAFGEALGYMEDRKSGRIKLIDVHGAGAQRSDLKTGHAEMFPTGRGPQGDVVRIENYVRLVRSVNVSE